jgi:hypothetical protein
VPSASCFEDIKEDDLQGVRRKEQAYQAWRQDPAIQQELQRADAYTAAFFLPKQDSTQEHVPVSQNLDELERGSLLSPAMTSAVRTAAEDFRILHWHLAFPDAMKAGGFDCVLGNPPWERIKLQEKEFFAARSQEIANAPNKAAREQLIKALSAENASVADRALMREFELAKREAEGSGEFIRCTGRFALTAIGDLNTYALFAEHFLNLICLDGRAGVIVPTGIATDNSTKGYFESITSKGLLISLISFENEAFIFKEIHHAFKFCLLTLRGDESKLPSSQFAFYIRHLHQLANPERHFTLTSNDIALLNPLSRTCPIFRSRADAYLTKKIYSHIANCTQQSEIDAIDAWQIKFATLFHMSNDAHHFTTAKELRDKGAIRDGQIWHLGDELFCPLYEARMIGNSCHKHASFTPGVDGRGFRVLPLTPHADLVDPDADGEPYYWIPKSHHDERVSRLPGVIRFAFKNITAATNERTFIGCFLPIAFSAADTLPLISSGHQDRPGFTLAMQGLNSLVFDFCARQKVSGLHMTYFILRQLPIIKPDQISAPDRAFILPRLLRLSVTTHSQMQLAEQAGVQLDIPYSWNPEERILIHAELDAYYAHLYGLSRDELRYILDPADLMGPDYPSETFRVLKNNEIRQFGEYRTQRLVLEAWDRLFGGLNTAPS